jgi:hypothetical protein
MDVNELYAKHKKLVYTMATNIYRHNANQIEFDDALSEANLIFSLCAIKCDAKREQKFGIYFAKSYRLHMYSIFKGRKTRDGDFMPHYLFANELILADDIGEENFLDTFPDPRQNIEDKILLKVTLESLSRDARICADLIDKQPEEIFIGTKTVSPPLSKPMLTRHLRKKGWMPKRIASAFREISSAIA